MKDVISFSVSGSHSIHELQLGLTLIHFAQFDLAYFREQSVAAYRKDVITGVNILEKSQVLKEFIRSCHPYCNALINSELDKIVLDCVIEAICAEDGIGLEELWAKNLTARDRFGQAIFTRITEYKTGHAINQWTNLQRLHAYALAKIAHIYGGVEADVIVHKARKLYYDTVFRLTASALGFQSDDLPKVRVYSIPLLPESAAMMKSTATALEPVVKALVGAIGARAPLKGRECVQDQMAGMALNMMMNLKPPENDDIRQLVWLYGTLPQLVYEPSCFKAIIDLEFDLLLEKGFYLQPDKKTYVRVKYSSKKETPPKLRTPSAQKNQSAKKIEPKEHDAEAVTNSEADKTATEDNAATTAQENMAEDNTALAPESPRDPINVTAGLQSESAARVGTIVDMTEDPNRQVTKPRTLQEVNARCNLIWTSMNVRTGWSKEAEVEMAEWFRYLTRLRYRIGTGDLTYEVLDKFIDATQEIFKLLPENE